MRLLIAVAVAALVSSLAPVTVQAQSVPVIGYHRNYRWDWDIDWLKQTGGFRDDYPYDPSLFYYTLPSRARSFALHPYTRDQYYQYYHDVPPPPGYEDSQVTRQEAYSCGNYSFMRIDRVPPYGYRCQK